MSRGGKVVVRRCGWCRKRMGVTRNATGRETTGICEACGVRLEADAALNHALVGLRAVTTEVERAHDDLWKGKIAMRTATTRRKP